MKRLGNWMTGCVVLGLLLGSCFDPPQYSPIPAIEFDNIVFKDIADASVSDSLILTIRFKDGDGNLGLGNNDTGCYNIDGKQVCFNEKWYFQQADGSLITYKNYRINHASGKNDTLPAFVKPANCLRWEIRPVNSTKNAPVDTFLVLQNPNYYNIFIEFYVKNEFPAGTYTQYKIEEQFGYPQCANSFNGRFPVLASDKSPLDGTIRYAMQSVGFNAVFAGKTLNLKITIQDRALNKSNTVETGDFDLTKIRRSG